MARRVSLLALAVAVVFGFVPAAADNRPELRTERQRYRPRQMVVIRLTNDTGREISFKSPWRIRDRHSGDVVSRYYWTPGERSFEPGDRRVWEWSQDPNQYSTEAKTQVGGHVGPGSYIAEVDIADYTLRRAFKIGRYFTLGFRCGDTADCDPPNPFVVFVTKDKAIKRMKQEAESEDKTLIVSGIVSRKVRYNPHWSYSMGSQSIVLGEVFTEVCDAHPEYVEDHKKQWTGERWCPWSSFVKNMGR